MVPDRSKATDLAKAEDDARKSVIQVVGGLALIAGLYFTGRNAWLMREGQITDRYTKAVAQLGDKALDVRLGGIYALERIAHDSHRDHWVIMEVLTAFVRERAPRKEKSVSPPPNNTLRREEQPGDYIPPPEVRAQAEHAPKLTTDVQAALTVIGRRQPQYDKPGGRLNLRETGLSTAALPVAHLANADLSGADLSGANLSGANLSGADLVRARLSGATSPGPTSSELTSSGPTSSGPASPGPTSPGPTSPERTSPGPTSSRLT